MTFEQRIDALQEILDDIQSTSSLNEKREIIDNIPLELKDDFNCILEVLNGKHIFGYKIGNVHYPIALDYDDDKDDFKTVREVIAWLERPRNENHLTDSNIRYHIFKVGKYYDFFQPIVDRELKLGIGNSLLEKSDTAPMLAKKYEGANKLKVDEQGYFITEKLDGNRCISYYDGEKWNFVSRNGKPMYVEFDMSNLPTGIVYDGEILSPKQVEMSINISQLDFREKFGSQFNSTSGMINRHTGDKELIYNIFDIQKNWPYWQRRQWLDNLANKNIDNFVGKNVRILPTLARFGNTKELGQDIDELLFDITGVGGEGLMINLASERYTHKRTMNLLKYKEAKTMDMLVIDTYGGTGKYEGMCGGLTCQAVTSDGKVINCNVGSGLSDIQRTCWRNGDLIKGKIVEVEYFSLSQDEISQGTNYYSLRFPRLKKVRADKNKTSEY